MLVSEYAKYTNQHVAFMQMEIQKAFGASIHWVFVEATMLKLRLGNTMSTLFRGCMKIAHMHGHS